MIVSTPTAHILSLVYKKPSHFVEDITLLSTRALVSRSLLIDKSKGFNKYEL